VRGVSLPSPIDLTRRPYNSGPSDIWLWIPDGVSWHPYRSAWFPDGIRTPDGCGQFLDGFSAIPFILAKWQK